MPTSYFFESCAVTKNEIQYAVINRTNGSLLSFLWKAETLYIYIYIYIHTHISDTTTKIPSNHSFSMDFNIGQNVIVMTVI
jgi:hypothetical protein